MDNDRVFPVALVQHVLQKFTAETCDVLQLSNSWHAGTEGSIAMTRQAAEAIGGYDEELLPVGYDDFDVLGRAAAYGLRVLKETSRNLVGYTLPNRDPSCAEEAELTNAQIRVQHTGSKLRFGQMDARNRETSWKNVRGGVWQANVSGRCDTGLKRVQPEAAVFPPQLPPFLFVSLGISGGGGLEGGRQPTHRHVC